MDSFRLEHNGRKVMVGSQCTRVGCDGTGWAEFPVALFEKIGRELLEELRERAEEGTSSIGGWQERGQLIVAEKLLEKALDALNDPDHFLWEHPEVPIPWDLAPPLMCEDCVAELLSVAGESVADWWDAREKGELW